VKWVPIGVAVLLTCVLAVQVAESSSGYATTPTSPGAIDPKAIPLGDGYVSTAPKVGYVDSCLTTFGGAGGAQVVGPWINSTAKTWDETTKIAVSGTVRWPNASFSEKVVGPKRSIRFNDLPVGHATGVFPVASNDPAFNYDRNPNHIAAQSVSWSLPATPSAARAPSCVGLGAIGVLDDGAYLYDALDGEGRDAAAHEVLDACAGHPDMSGSYHHHDVPPCLLDTAPNGKPTLVGYALDGYGIFVVKDAHGDLPTNTSLDACHGATSVVPWNGKRTRIYHYVATLEYPYTVGCYHGTPISVGRASGGPPPPGPGGP
jgi:hypothetical protein